MYSPECLIRLDKDRMVERKGGDLVDVSTSAWDEGLDSFEDIIATPARKSSGDDCLLVAKVRLIVMDVWTFSVH